MTVMTLKPIANGNRRDPVAALRAKLKGVDSGVLDEAFEAASKKVRGETLRTRKRNRAR
jgi:hypothetical protein